jgi:L-fuculose-phosphate aldolase
VLENHGVVTSGTSLHHAFERFETLEFTAKTVIKASLLGPVRYLSEEGASRPRLPALPSAEVGPPTSLEKELRRQLAEFVRRSYQQRLMISTQGAFSARIDQDAFLVTPHRLDRSTLDVSDIVLVRRGAAEPGKVASSSARGHQAIYERHPDVQAIVNAYPVNATAFSVTDMRLDSRTIPESYIFLRDVGRVPYGVRFRDPQELAQLSSPRDPILILDNDGVQVCGTSILDAFDRLEVLESTAEAVINAAAMHTGPISPMSDEVIAELRQAFGMD